MKRIFRRRKPKLQVRNPRLAPVIDIFENDESATFIPGSPGYRVARNRSGLGYLETQAESARIQGTMISWLFNGKYHRTKEPLVLIGMFLTGFMLAGIPLILVLGEFISSRNPSKLVLLVLDIPSFAFGFAILMSTFKNLAKIIADLVHSFSA